MLKSCCDVFQCGSTSQAHKKQASDLFGEDLTQRSILHDLDGNFLGGMRSSGSLFEKNQCEILPTP